jgi:hypothetical protein
MMMFWKTMRSSSRVTGVSKVAVAPGWAGATRSTTRDTTLARCTVHWVVVVEGAHPL